MRLLELACAMIFIALCSNFFIIGLKMAKVTNSDNHEIMIDVSEFEDLLVLAFHLRNLTIELNKVESE